MRTQSQNNGVAFRAVEDLARDNENDEVGTERSPEPLRPHRQEEPGAQAQSMEAMGRLAGGIAHVFNNLLTAIACEVELALVRMSPDDPARKHLREIERNGDRAAGLARQLLAFSGRQVMQPKTLQLNQLLTGLQDRLRHVLGDSIELRMELDPDLGRIHVDSQQLEQAILNLASNARDVMTQGGRLTLESRNVEVRSTHLAHPLRSSPGRWVQLAVSDTGPGMTDEVRRRVFEPFFSTKQGEMTGLGLSMVYGIVAQSGGQIVVESEPGKGSRFLIYLPSADEASQADAPDASGRPWETILLVEDEDNVRRPLTEILQSRGYRVLEAADGAQAIEISKQHTGPIHLMVTDILMAGMTGVELAEKLSYDRAGMKVLFATGYPAGLAEGSGLDKADTNLLKKPFSGKDLAAKVREILESAD
jgi:two-component system cell cycle sensor histidine kinase/response regulator CckA